MPVFRKCNPYADCRLSTTGNTHGAMAGFFEWEVNEISLSPLPDMPRPEGSSGVRK
jgi:hypothetical protein